MNDYYLASSLTCFLLIFHIKYYTNQGLIREESQAGKLWLNHKRFNFPQTFEINICLFLKYSKCSLNK